MDMFIIVILLIFLCVLMPFFVNFYDNKKLKKDFKNLLIKYPKFRLVKSDQFSVFHIEKQTKKGWNIVFTYEGYVEDYVKNEPYTIRNVVLKDSQIYVQSLEDKTIECGFYLLNLEYVEAL